MTGIQHMMIERAGPVYTTKCGEQIDTTRPPGCTFTGWWHKVTCPACVTAMNLTAEQMARLNP